MIEKFFDVNIPVSLSLFWTNAGRMSHPIAAQEPGKLAPSTAGALCSLVRNLEEETLSEDPTALKFS